MKAISSPSIGFLDTRFVNVTGDTMTGDLTFNDDVGLVFGSGYGLKYNSDVGTLYMSAKTGDVHGELSFEKAIYIYSNAAVDGSGSYEPVLHLTHNGAVNLNNTTQGTAAARVFTIHMNKVLIDPDTNRTDTFSITQADGTAVFDVDTINRKVVVTSGTTGQSTIDAGLIVNNASGGGAIDDFQVNTDTMTAILVDASANTMVLGVPTTLNKILTMGDKILSDTDSTDDLGSSSVYWANAYIDKVYSTAVPVYNSSLWYRASHQSVFAVSPGASGATFTVPSANTLGGYQLNAATEYLYFGDAVGSMWDEASDLEVTITFEVNVDNTGGADADTVDLQLICYYKGGAETACKSQTLEEAKTVGKSAQYQRWGTTFTIDYDAVANVVEQGDKINFRLNLETDTSEVDDIIVNTIMYRYKTAKMNPEV